MKQNSRRVVAAAGALAVASVTVTGVIAGTATAAGTGTCTSSVNVRSEPSTTAPIVGVCERGESTSVGGTEDGFVELPEFGGWAVADYVSTSTSSSPQTGTSEDSLTPSSTERSATPSTSTPSTADSTDSTESTDSSAPSEPSEESGTAADRSTMPSSSPESSSDDSSFFDDED